MTSTPNSAPGLPPSTMPQKETVYVPASLQHIALYLNSEGFTTAIYRGIPRTRRRPQAAQNTTTVWRLTWWRKDRETSGEHGRLWVEVGGGRETPSTSE